jgi:hypothetical protein
MRYMSIHVASFSQPQIQIAACFWCYSTTANLIPLLHLFTASRHICKMNLIILLYRAPICCSLELVFADRDFFKVIFYNIIYSYRNANLKWDEATW